VRRKENQPQKIAEICNTKALGSPRLFCCPIGGYMENENFEYQLAKSILQWLVTIKILTPIEAQEIDALNKIDFGVA
jgi:hypothetical protein